MIDAIFEHFGWPQYLAMAAGTAIIIITLAAVIKDGIRAWRHHVDSRSRGRIRSMKDWIKSLQVQRDEAQSSLRNLLAVIDGDGGQKQASDDSLSESAQRAERAVAWLLHNNAALEIERQKVKELTEIAVAYERRLHPKTVFAAFGSAVRESELPLGKALEMLNDAKQPCRMVGPRRIVEPTALLGNGTDVLNGLAERLYQIETFLCENQGRPFNETIVRQ